MRKTGLNDSDKLFVTAALWISAMSLFAAAITLHMLPDNVTIVYKSVIDTKDFYSKYNNLLTTLGTAIPAIIILISASLRSRNKIVSNFTSIMMFCIILSACMGGVTIYGIMRQIDASGVERRVDNYIAIAITASAILSAVFAFMPMVIHSKRYTARSETRRVYSVFVGATLDRYWNVGAYGFIVAAIFCSFVAGPFTFIPLAIAVAAQAIFVLSASYVTMKHSMETRIYDMIES